MLFKRFMYEKILNGEKTVSRRPIAKKQGRQRYEVGKVYGIRNGYKPYGAWILIKRKYRQKLRDMTEQDAHKEGFEKLEDFKQTWIDLYGQWNPQEVVFVYEFELTSKPESSTKNKTLMNGGVKKGNE